MNIEEVVKENGFFEKGKRVVICISAANLLLLAVWVELLPGTMEQYVLGYRATIQSILGIWINIVLLGIAIYLGHCAIAKSKWVVPITICSGIVIITAMVFPIYRIVQSYFTTVNSAKAVEYLGQYKVIAIVTIALSGVLLFRFVKSILIYRAIKMTLLVFISLPVILTILVIGNIAERGNRETKKSFEVYHQNKSIKTVVLIFDEWDYDYSFPQRPTWIRLPEIDRFSREYGNYTNCWPAAGETLKSIPSLATGKRWLGAKPYKDGDLLLRETVSEKWISWSEKDDLFVTLKKYNWKTKMIQWWHVFQQKYLESRTGLVVSHYSESQNEDDPKKDYETIIGTMARSYKLLAKSILVFSRVLFQKDIVPKRVYMARKMMDELITTVQSRQYDLIWAHLPFPHQPAIANARTGKFLEKYEPRASSLDNMVLVDRTLGMLRKEMENIGEWEQAMVILTADHWQRENSGQNLPLNPKKYGNSQDYRIPLLVKWPGQKESWTISKPVDSISIRRMIESVAEGKNKGKKFVMEKPPFNIREMLLDD